MLVTLFLLLSVEASAANRGAAPKISGPPPAPTHQNRSIRTVRPYRRAYGLGYGGFYNSTSIERIPAEPASPLPEDKLHELVVSPTYKQDKITPKMIEIPN
ncbi:hypothetical protein [Bryobacter aggregatus]|uniref:hypothetical protein n=1 Tax=Bryobacter aggregatus TaxID=360054 RepID=UPI0004E23903|nr:hypothetical protein [Bryobacter aggregatus]